MRIAYNKIMCIVLLLYTIIYGCACSETEQELLIISYYSDNRCSKYSQHRKSVHQCMAMRRAFCNCMRVNLQQNISINYV